MTKKQIIQWLKEAGFPNTSYSGNSGIIYVHGISQMQLNYFALDTKGVILKAD